MLLSKNLEDKLNSCYTATKLNGQHWLTIPVFLLHVIDDEYVTALLKKRSVSLDEFKGTLRSLTQANDGSLPENQVDFDTLNAQKTNESPLQPATEDEFKFVSNPNNGLPTRREITPSQKFVRVIQRAIHTNQQKQYGPVDCIHVLAASLKEKDECANQLIQNYGLNYELVDEFIIEKSISMQQRNKAYASKSQPPEAKIANLERRVLMLESEVAALKKQLGH